MKTHCATEINYILPPKNLLLLPIRPYGVYLPVQSVPMPIYGGFFASANCVQIDRAFLAVQSIPMPVHGRLFASAKCPCADIWGPVGQCKVSPCPYIGAVLPVQNVPMPIRGVLGAVHKVGTRPCPTCIVVPGTRHNEPCYAFI